MSQPRSKIGRLAHWFGMGKEDGGSGDGTSRTTVSRSEFAEFLPEIQAVAERNHSPLAGMLIFTVAGAFLVGLMWAYFAKVDQVATAPGVVRPVGKTKTINHPEGGRVAEILVREGDTVEAGAALLKLDPELFRKQVDQLDSERQRLKAEVARFEAEVQGQQHISFPFELIANRADLVEAQKQAFQARTNTLASRRTAAEQVIEQRSSEVAAVRESINRLIKTLKVLDDQERMLSESVKKGYYPELRYLELKREIIEQNGQIAELKNQVIASRSALEEARTRRQIIDREARSEVIDELETRRKELEAVQTQLAQAMAHLRNLDIISPVAGVVQNLAVTSVGQAVRPSDTIMMIVPTGASLVVAARLSNDDIGYVKTGQLATVKIRTYDFLRYGTLEGVVEQISADATEDKRTGEFMFDVFVRTKQTFVGSDMTQLAVQPGMLVDVDLHIGQRSILSYLTDRVLFTTSTAFRER